MSDYVTVTIRVHKDVKAKWVSLAESKGLSVGKLIQAAMSSGTLDAKIVEPLKNPLAPEPKAVPVVSGVHKASDIPMPKLDKYVPKPQPKRVMK